MPAPEREVLPSVEVRFMDLSTTMPESWQGRADIASLRRIRRHACA